jgi:hypothetical protein
VDWLARGEPVFFPLAYVIIGIDATVEKSIAYQQTLMRSSKNGREREKTEVEMMSLKKRNKRTEIRKMEMNRDKTSLEKPACHVELPAKITFVYYL